jgi:hypothetical protein
MEISRFPADTEPKKKKERKFRLLSRKLGAESNI